MLKVAVIDDQEKYLLNWQLCLKDDATVLSFFHHRQCFAYFEKKPNEVSELDYIIADRFVPDYDAIADNFANDFRKCFPTFKGVILLSSSAHKAGESIGRGFLTSLGKKAMPHEEIQQIITKNSKPS